MKIRLLILNDCIPNALRGAKNNFMIPITYPASRKQLKNRLYMLWPTPRRHY